MLQKSITIIKKGVIEEPRTILIILTDEERADQLSIPFTLENHSAWWIAKLRSMGAWATKLLRAEQMKENGEWTNNFQIDYK